MNFTKDEADHLSEALYMAEETAEVSDEFATADLYAILNHRIRTEHGMSQDNRLARINRRGVQA